MEFDRFLNVSVPVSPVVGAGKLLIFVRHLERFEMLVKGSVVFEEGILGTTIDPHRGDVLGFHGFDLGEGVFGSAFGVVSEDH